SVDDEQEQPERQDDQGKREQLRQRLDDGVDQTEDERDEDQREPVAVEDDAADELGGNPDRGGVDQQSKEQRDRKLRDVLLGGVARDPLDLDRALGEHGRNGTDGRQHRRQHRADDADGQREFDHRPALLLDDDAADVALVNDLLDRVEQLV